MAHVIWLGRSSCMDWRLIMRVLAAVVAGGPGAWRVACAWANAVPLPGHGAAQLGCHSSRCRGGAVASWQRVGSAAPRATLAPLKLAEPLEWRAVAIGSLAAGGCLTEFWGQAAAGAASSRGCCRPPGAGAAPSCLLLAPSLSSLASHSP